MPSTLPSGSRLPLTANPHFVGREAELRRLVNELREGVTVAVGQTVATTGLGGIGKTQLAVEFAHRYGKYFPGGVFWFNFDQPEAIAGQIADTGGPGCLNLRPDFNELKLAEQLQIVQKAWQEATPRLLIFDGCEAEAPLVEWRPPHGGCRIIITSRRGQWSAGLGITSLPLGVFSREESINLLRQLRSDLTEAEANDIAEELGDLPLALHLAGSFLAAYQYDVSPTDYLTRLKALRGGKLLEHPSLKGLGTTYSPTAHEAHVARTFALSYERLDETNERDVLAQALLARAAHFAPNEPIPRFLLQGSAKNLLKIDDEQDFLLPQALQRLAALGLLNEGEGGSIRLHQLVTEFVQGMGEDLIAQTDVEEAVLAEAKKLEEDPDPSIIRPWLSHLQFVIENSKAQFEGSATIGGLYDILGTYLWINAEYSKAQQYLNKGLKVRESLLKPSYFDIGKSLSNLGVLLQDIGNYEEARSYFDRALATYEAVVGLEHPETALALSNLGTLLEMVGHYEEAKLYFERALLIRKATLGYNHIHTAQSLSNIGVLLDSMGSYEEAKLYKEQALAINEAVLGSNHPETGKSLNNLGILLQKMGNYEGARSYLEHALIVFEETLGPNHPSTATSLNNVGNLLQVMGDYEKAIGYYEQALSIKEVVLEPDHPQMALGLNNLGFLLQKMGNYEAAKPYYERAMTIFNIGLGPGHPLTAYPLKNLGLLHQNMGNLAEARPYLEQALAIREKALGPEHPDTAQSHSQLGHFLQVSGDIENARIHYEQALAIQEKTLEPNHPDTVDTLHKLGTLQRVIGNLSNARPYLERALSIRAEKLGADHQETATTLYELGLLDQAMGNLSGARNYFQRALSAFEVALGPDHEKTQVVRASLRELDEE